ncbi:hypothetical protein [Clostridium sp.]|uniref:hypothetical protein n=1 Tax=Clostridium sp. TaxID=1506 RepID=UPI00345B53B8
MKFRKKPVIIDAIQFDGNIVEIEEFCGGYAENRNGEIVISTLEGELHASPKDYIIKGVPGEFYPCKPSVFTLSYESVDYNEDLL